MKDRVVEHPARYQLVPVAGTTDTFDLIPVPGVVTEEGDDISKATLLEDDTVNNVGDIKQSVRTNLGDSFALCNGADYETTDYPLLAAVDANPARWAVADAHHANAPVYGNGYYVYVGADAYLYYSTTLYGVYTKGAKWYYSNTNNSFSLHFINGYFVGICYDMNAYYVYMAWTTTPTTSSMTAISSYGINWQSTGKSVVTHCGSYYFTYLYWSGYNDSRIYYGSLGSMSQGTAITGTVRGIAASATRVCAFIRGTTSPYTLTAYSALASAPAGWTAATIATGINGNSNSSIKYEENSGYFVIASQDSASKDIVLYRSADGLTWTTTVIKAAHTEAVSFGAVQYFNGNYFIVCYNTVSNKNILIFYSNDITSETWTMVTALESDTAAPYYQLYAFSALPELVDTTTDPDNDILLLPMYYYDGSTLSAKWLKTKDVAGYVKALPTLALDGAYAYIRVE